MTVLLVDQYFTLGHRGRSDWSVGECIVVVEVCQHGICKSNAIEWTVILRKSDMRWALMFSFFWLQIRLLNIIFWEHGVHVEQRKQIQLSCSDYSSKQTTTTSTWPIPSLPHSHSFFPSSPSFPPSPVPSMFITTNRNPLFFIADVVVVAALRLFCLLLLLFWCLFIRYICRCDVHVRFIRPTWCSAIYIRRS